MQGEDEAQIELLANSTRLATSLIKRQPADNDSTKLLQEIKAALGNSSYNNIPNFKVAIGVPKTNKQFSLYLHAPNLNGDLYSISVGEDFQHQIFAITLNGKPFTPDQSLSTYKITKENGFDFDKINDDPLIISLVSSYITAIHAILTDTNITDTKRSEIETFLNNQITSEFVNRSMQNSNTKILSRLNENKPNSDLDAKIIQLLRDINSYFKVGEYKPFNKLGIAVGTSTRSTFPYMHFIHPQDGSFISVSVNANSQVEYSRVYQHDKPFTPQKPIGQCIIQGNNFSFQKTSDETHKSLALTNLQAIYSIIVSKQSEEAVQKTLNSANNELLYKTNPRNPFRQKADIAPSGDNDPMGETEEEKDNKELNQSQPSNKSNTSYNTPTFNPQNTQYQASSTSQLNNSGYSDNNLPQSHNDKKPLLNNNSQLSETGNKK